MLHVLQSLHQAKALVVIGPNAFVIFPDPASRQSIDRNLCDAVFGPV